MGLLSVAFLGRRLAIREWLGMATVIVGLVVVGVADFATDSSDSGLDTNSVITGDLLIVVAQVITSVQMVVEEKFVAGLDIPALQAVGWEGNIFIIINYLLIVDKIIINVKFLYYLLRFFFNILANNGKITYR